MMKIKLKQTAMTITMSLLLVSLNGNIVQSSDFQYSVIHQIQDRDTKNKQVEIVYTDGFYVDKSNLSNGTIKVLSNLNLKDVKYKIAITKDNKTYYYTILNNEDNFPLQFGNGKYKIQIYKNIKDTSYIPIQEYFVEVNIKNSNDVYLNSIQNINWSKDMKLIKIANKLTKECKNDREKILKIHEYLIKNYKYDSLKIKGLKVDYTPSIEQLSNSKKAICYDYSAMMASMLRSIGVPTKLIKGYADEIKEYHAWNEVYLKDTKEWLIIDTTYDACVYHSNYVLRNNIDEIKKNVNKYHKEKEY